LVAVKVPALTPPENTPVVAVIVTVTDKFEVEIFDGLNTLADNVPATERSVTDALVAEKLFVTKVEMFASLELK